MNKHSPEKIQSWLVRILGHEGGYSDDRKDPGGETKWGISKRSYPNLNIKELTVESAAEIYIKDFLEPLKADNYEDGVAFQMFDFAVNSGVGTALRRIQMAVGVADDGHIGPATLAAIAKHSESDLIMLVLAQRIDYMTYLKNWPSHGKGWMRRIATNLRHGAADSD